MNRIPTELHADLSPLLVAAGEWPDPADALLPSPSSAADPAGEALLSAVALFHPALRNAPAARRLHRDADGALYYRLTHDEPDPLPEEGDPWAAWTSWDGWASRAPVERTGLEGIAFWVVDREGRSETGDRSRLEAALPFLLDPDLHRCIERSDPSRVRPAPAVQGPHRFACIWHLDAASGWGLLYPWFYAYTDGRSFIGVFQVVAHSSLAEQGG